MEIKQIHYKRTVNLGNYSSETLEMTADLNGDDDADECAKNLKAKVIELLAEKVVLAHLKVEPISQKNDNEDF